MRKHLTALGGAVVSAAIFAVLMAPNAAFAVDPADLQGNPGTSSINISGSVPAITYLPAAPISVDPPINASLAGNAVTITELADASAHTNSSYITLGFENVTTNYPAKIGLFSVNKALKNGAYFVSYTAQATTTGLTTPLCNFSGGVVDCKSSNAVILDAATIEIEIKTITDATQILPAGIYSDVLTLKVGSSL